ncbi:MAG: hypothetical protein ACM3TR_09845 [Caulobacteraceae bacterium]
MKNIDGRTPTRVPVIAGAGGIAVGDLVVGTLSAAVKAAAAPSAGTVIGICTVAAAQSAVGEVELISGRVLRAPYTGSTKTSLADTDFGTVFDLSNSTTVNLDDTTGGCCVCVGYDNNNDTIDFRVPESFLYIA